MGACTCGAQAQGVQTRRHSTGDKRTRATTTIAQYWGFISLHRSQCCVSETRSTGSTVRPVSTRPMPIHGRLAHGVLKPPPTPLLASKKSPIYPWAEKPHQIWPPSVSKAEHQHQRSTPPPQSIYPSPSSPSLRAEHSPHTAPTHSPAGQSRNKTTTPDHRYSCTGPY